MLDFFKRGMYFNENHGGHAAMSTKRLFAILFYIGIVLLILFVYFYVQPRWRYEQTHPQNTSSITFSHHT